jgi:hypothetical protein
MPRSPLYEKILSIANVAFFEWYSSRANLTLHECSVIAAYLIMREISLAVNDVAQAHDSETDSS